MMKLLNIHTAYYFKYYFKIVGYILYIPHHAHMQHKSVHYKNNAATATSSGSGESCYWGVGSLSKYMRLCTVNKHL